MTGDRYESLFRQLTPLVLIGIAVVALFGTWVPGAAWCAQQFGPNFVLGFCVALLGLYTLLLWGETLRLHALMTGVLKELVDFRNRQAGSAQKRLEAVRMLLPALASSDPDVRQKSRKNLTLLVGEDLGEHAAPWQAWLERQDRSPRE